MGTFLTGNAANSVFRFPHDVRAHAALFILSLATTQVVCEEGTGTESPVLQLPVQVEIFNHSQGYTQYRLVGFKSAAERFSGWRIETWVKLSEDLVQMRIGECQISE